MIDRLFTWLEGRVDPFPPERPGKPPAGFFAFSWHYTKPFRWLLVASMLFSAVIAFLEVYLFSFLGNLVDLLTKADRATFWDTHWQILTVMGVIVLRGAAGPQLPVRVDLAPGPARQLRHAHPLGGASLCAAPEHGVLLQ